MTLSGAAERFDDDHLEEVGRRIFRRGLACSWRAVCNRKCEKQDSGIAVSKEEVSTSFSGQIQLPAKASQRPLFGTLVAFCVQQHYLLNFELFVQEIETLVAFCVQQHYLLKFELCH